MKKLEENWLTKGWMDLEYKKYILLAYLKEVGGQFNESKLYPFLSDLVSQYRELFTLRENQSIVKDSFPKKISKLDFEKFKIEYEKLIEEEEYMEELEKILDFAIPKMKTHLGWGKEIYDFVEDKIQIFPVGVIPMHKNEGYLLLFEPSIKNIDVYQYTITIFENNHENYRAIKTEYITSYRSSITNTYNFIKSDLIHQKKDMPNPCTFVAESKIAVPREATLLPITKRSLIRMIEMK